MGLITKDKYKAKREHIAESHNNETIDINGYVGVYMPEHEKALSNGYVYEHILMAEQMLGRKLKEGECVHHIDRNRGNNSIENLMVFKTKGDHTAFHQGDKLIYDEKENNYYCLRKTITIKNKRYKECPICANPMSPKSMLCINCRNEKKSSSIPQKEELKN